MNFSDYADGILKKSSSSALPQGTWEKISPLLGQLQAARSLAERRKIYEQIRSLYPSALPDFDTARQGQVAADIAAHGERVRESQRTGTPIPWDTALPNTYVQQDVSPIGPPAPAPEPVAPVPVIPPPAAMPTSRPVDKYPPPPTMVGAQAAAPPVATPELPPPYSMRSPSAIDIYAQPLSMPDIDIPEDDEVPTIGPMSFADFANAQRQQKVKPSAFAAFADEQFGRKKSKFRAARESDLFDLNTPTPLVTDYAKDTGKVGKVLSIVAQAGQGVGNVASAGFAKKVFPEFDIAPTTSAEALTRGMGEFAGLILPFSLPHKVGALVGKGISQGALAIFGAKKVLQSGKAIVEATNLSRGVGYFAGRIGSLSATLGLMDAADPETIKENAIAGAKLGAIFAGTGLLKFTGRPFVSQILRQFGGRALIAATGGGSLLVKGALDRENLAQTVWHEALTSYFLYHGITLKNMLTGKVDPLQQARIDHARNILAYENGEVVYPRVNEELKVPADAFLNRQTEKVPVENIQFNDLMADLDSHAYRKSNSEWGRRVKLFYDQLVGAKGQLPKDKLLLAWDDARGAYVTWQGDSALAAIRQYNRDAVMRKWAPIEEVRATIIRPKPGDVARMALPTEIAAKFGQDAVTAKGTEQILAQKLWTINAVTNKIRPFSGPLNKNSRLYKNEILFKIDDMGKPTVLAQHKGLAGKTIYKGEGIPTVTLRASMADALEGMLGLEQRYPGIANTQQGSAGANPIPLQARTDYAALRVSLDNILVKLNLEARKAINSGLKFTELKKGQSPYKIDVDQLASNLSERVLRVRTMPEAELPMDWMEEYIGKRLKSMGSHLDASSVMDAVSVNFSSNHKWIVRDLFDIELTLNEMESMPPWEQPALIMTGFKNRYSIPLRAIIDTELRAIDSRQNLLSRATLSKAYADAKFASESDPSSGSLMDHLLRFPAHISWLNIEKAMNWMQERTGLPLLDITERVLHGTKMVKLEKEALMTILEPYSQTSPEVQRNVQEEFGRLYRKLDPPPGSSAYDAMGRMIDASPMSPLEQGYMRAINDVMRRLAPRVIRVKYSDWFDNVWGEDLDNGLKKDQLRYVKDHPDEAAAMRRFMRTGQGTDAEITKMMEYLVEQLKLKKGVPLVFAGQEDPVTMRTLWDWKNRFRDARINAREGDKKAWDEFDVFFSTAGKHIGRIYEGTYIPEQILATSKVNFDEARARWQLDPMGRGSTLPRKAQPDIEMVDRMMDYLRGQHMNVKFDRYIKNILNLDHLEGPLTQLARLVNMFEPHFSNSQQKPFGRAGKESKAPSTLDFLHMFASRAKGYPMIQTGFGRVMKSIQGSFFKSLVVRPNTILRNLPQMFVTPIKKMLLMRSIGPKYNYKNLRPELREFFDIEVDESPAFNNTYLETQAGGWHYKLPGMPQLMAAAEWVGKFYTLTDQINRKFVFSKVAFSSEDIINKWKKGEYTTKQMDQKLGLGSITNSKASHIRELISQGKELEASAQLAKWHTDNSQWIYGREQRSPEEMSGMGESFSNLLVWPKSMLTSMVETSLKIRDGFQMTQLHSPEHTKQGLRMMADGASTIVGVTMAGMLVNQILNTMMVQHGTKNSAFGLGTMTWQFGGMPGGLLTELTGAMSDVVNAVDGTDEDRAISLKKLLQYSDRVLFRQLIPFSKNALSIVESFTGRSYISPVKEQWEKITTGRYETLTYVQRTWLEGITHALFNSDPAKQETIRKFTFTKLNDLKVHYYQEKNPAMKLYLGEMVRKYEYLNDLYSRYEPMEAWSNEQKKQQYKYEQEFKNGLQQKQWEADKQFRRTKPTRYDK